MVDVRSVWFRSATLSTCRQAINEAKHLQLSHNPSPEAVREVNARLLQYLAPDDEFWPRWRFFAEKMSVD